MTGTFLYTFSVFTTRQYSWGQDLDLIGIKSTLLLFFWLRNWLCILKLCQHFILLVFLKYVSQMKSEKKDWMWEEGDMSYRMIRESKVSSRDYSEGGMF